MGTLSRDARQVDGKVLPGMATIVCVGFLVGIAFNWQGLSGPWAWGLPWIALDPLDQLESVEDLVVGDESAAISGGYDQITDPMAVGLGASSAVPEIPVLDRPVQIRMEALRQLYDAGAALIVDAREPGEYAEGHLAGALNLPFDEVSAEPERLEQLDPDGRPIVTYCGGGTCEDSLGLAWDLIAAGHTRVVVYVGGFAEWAEAGHPVETGAAAAGGRR